MTDLNTKLILQAHEAIFERGPTIDPHVEIFRRQCERDANLRELVSGRTSERDDPRDAEEFFLDQQSPSDGQFR